jgi:alpha-tubulin suppressor-like RCC1 family protein
MNGRRISAVASALILAAATSGYAVIVAPEAHAATAGEVAVGWFHTCAITTAGAALCWGDNQYGELGDGTTTNHSSPVSVSGSLNIAMITAGSYFTCALTTDSRVMCWGRNDQGQLGNGTTTESHAPVQVTGLPSGGWGRRFSGPRRRGSVVAISSGVSYTCALTSNGAVLCWGTNRLGQLGAGSTLSYSPKPLKVSGLSSGVDAIDARGSHTCALTSAGGMKCWGSNHYGELGDGTTKTRVTPVGVSGLSSGVGAIGLGARHTCAMTVAGAAKCWGNDAEGELGDGTTGSPTCYCRLTPVDVVGLSSGMIAISGGDSHTCGLNSGGGVKCWGAGEALGAGPDIGQSTTPVDVVDFSSGGSSISANHHVSCALTTAGAVYCWGSTAFGLGDGSTTKSSTPIGVLGLS